jgi:hypothetical protein
MLPFRYPDRLGAFEPAGLLLAGPAGRKIGRLGSAAQFRHLRAPLISVTIYMNDFDPFKLAASQIVGKRLTWNETTGKNHEPQTYPD